ncbi:MAG: tetratricopeptide repeat protein [Geminicoccaceae bacterium]
MILCRPLILSAMVSLSVAACSGGHYDDAIPGSYGTSLKSGFAALEAKDYETAEADLAFAAKSGHPRALIAYGDLFANGRAVPFDPVRAKALYDEALGKSSSQKPKAAWSIGRLLLEGGEGPSGKLEANPQTARQLLLKALEDGEVRAASTLGEIYADGIGVDANVNAAIDYYEQAADSDRWAAKELAILLVETNSPEGGEAAQNAIAQFETRAAEGDDKAWLQLADFFTRDEIIEPDLDRAQAYLQNVPATGNPEVLVRLAKIYDKRGDAAQSKVFYQQAADIGDAQAQAKLAELMLKGGTNNTNGPLGRRYAEMAIAQGNEVALSHLGNALLKGDVLKPDPRLGEKLLRQGSEAGHAGSMAALGGWLLRNEITPRFPNEGRQILEVAAEQGSRGAMSTLGFAYHKGQGLPKDERAAVQWLQRAADAGHADAKKLLTELTQS